MGDLSNQHPTLTLHFRNAATHRALEQAAEALGVPADELAEAAIAHELGVAEADLETRLSRTVDLLRSLRQTDFQEDVDEFAESEVSVEDPLRARKVEEDDAYGVGAAFARPVE